ncbi:hypothetical protein HanIR_Chr17g0889961 [Helianthus annuus]|nr:hypothetical protein HanIR_Chr17g0889961 [Helianthus annuus]
MMADAFKTTVAGLQKELEALITDNQIQARIDSHNKILYARHADQRKATFQRVLQTGVEFDRDVRAMLLRAISSNMIITSRHQGRFETLILHTFKVFYRFRKNLEMKCNHMVSVLLGILF